MKRFSRGTALALAAWLAAMPPAFAANFTFLRITSPDHEQTFAYGLERDRVWAQWGRHLALLIGFTNDPDVDYSTPRQYDNFRFDFPSVRLGADGHTFYYRPPGGGVIPVAVKRPDFLGVEEVHLLPNVVSVVDRPHGTITVYLDILGVAQLTRK